ncbi:TBC1 domain family member 14-like [Hetaerina americana]|uniref:TBC1 domain family member 14-like n=1 Tax=Hetaerina americana TaxID=62018 RepID=UPI003A7F4BB3
MINTDLEDLHNGKSSPKRVVEARSDCRLVHGKYQGQEETTITVSSDEFANVTTPDYTYTIDSFHHRKVKEDGMGHPGLLFQLTNDQTVDKSRSISLPSNLESDKCVDRFDANGIKSNSGEKEAVYSNHEKLDPNSNGKVKNGIISHKSWFRTWPERGLDKYVCLNGNTPKNLKSGCLPNNGDFCLQNKESQGSVSADDVSLPENEINKTLSDPRSETNICVRNSVSSSQCTTSSPAHGCDGPGSIERNNISGGSWKCSSNPVSLSRLLESMPSLAYNPVTKGLQLAVSEREEKLKEGLRCEEDNIPRCTPVSLAEDEEDDYLCERVAPTWGSHHPGCLRNGRLESIEEEDDGERQKALPQQPTSRAPAEDPPVADLFPSLPPLPLPSTSSSSASLSSVSSLSTGTGGYSEDHSEGVPPISSLDSCAAGKESRRSSGLTGFFSRNLFAWKLSKDGYQDSNGCPIPEGSAPGWKLFGKVPPRQNPVARDPAIIAEEFQQAKSAYSDSNHKTSNCCNKGRTINMQKLEAAFSNGHIIPNGLDWGGKPVTVTNSTTALILENRPPNLPAKSAEEEERHRLEYQSMLEAARKKDLKEAKKRKKQLQQQLKLEEQLAHAVRVWNSEILPKWDTMKNSRKSRDLWWQGIPPSVRGKVWRLSISNDLNITPELYEICVSRAQERLKAAENGCNGSVSCNGVSSEGEGSGGQSMDSGWATANGESEEGGENPDKESSVELIQLDISRTFPHLCIFQEGGPYYDILHSLIGAYVCYRPDVGYVQGMSFLAAVLILNMDAPDAFICFANLLNRPCHVAFFRLKESIMEAYYATYKEFFRENLPKLCHHFEQQGLSPDLYLLEWLYTVFSKAMPLDIACRVWDVFLRDGEEFLFRTALGVLHLNQDLLLNLDFIRGAQFLTRLPDDLSSDRLFRSIEAVRMNIGKMKFSDVLSQHMEQCKREGQQGLRLTSTQPNPS